MDWQGGAGQVGGPKTTLNLFWSSKVVRIKVDTQVAHDIYLGCSIYTQKDKKIIYTMKPISYLKL